MTQTLSVTGMTCGGCENAVKRAVGKLPGVASVDASHAEQRVTVDFDDAQTGLDAIEAKIDRRSAIRSRLSATRRASVTADAPLVHRVLARALQVIRRHVGVPASYR